jgi:hypothetical protein
MTVVRIRGGFSHLRQELPRVLVIDPLIARIELELFGRGLPQRPRGSVGSHNFGSRIVAAWMLEEGKTGPRTTYTSRPEAHVWSDQCVPWRRPWPRQPPETEAAPAPA